MDLKQKLGINLKENIELKDFTTMKVGGKAKYFYVAEKLEDLINAVVTARTLGTKFIVLGGGSNIIVGDDGYDGLVILNRSVNMAFLPDKAQVIVDSGVTLMRLIMEAANRDLGGLEPLYGIPGTIGGAIYGNAGVAGSEFCSFLKGLTLLNAENKIIRVKSDWIRAGYRTTRIKEMKKNGKEIPIILSALIQLSRHKKEDILRKIQSYKTLREEKQPYDRPTAGSIFKNLGKEKEKTAGYILDQLGAKKMKVGGAEVSKKHANFIVNSKNATAAEIKELIKEMKKNAHDNYGVELEEEVEFI